MKVTHVRRKVMLSALAGAIMIPGSVIRAKAADSKTESTSPVPVAGIESVLTECLETNVKDNIDLYLIPTSEGEYLNRAFSNVEDFSYVRDAPNEESEWTGKIYSDSTVTVLEYKGDWTRIRSGNVEGYVPADSLYTGEEAKKHAKEYETDVATVLADVLNVRSGQGTENDILTQVMFRQQYEITGEPENGWYPVKVEEFDGWVCGDYVEAETTFSYAESKEEEEERLEQEKSEKQGAEAVQTAGGQLNRVSGNRSRSNGTRDQADRTAGNRNHSSGTAGSQTQSGSMSGTRTENPAGAQPGSTAGQHTEGDDTAQTGGAAGGQTQSDRTDGAQTGNTDPDETQNELPGDDAEQKADDTAEVLDAEAAQPQEYAGQAVIDFACQFIGNPYVWGGTSLTNGADCSGFVQSVYANFGIALPRTTYDMVNVGYEVSYDQALPGDLVLYDGHVGLYMGDGTIVNAMNEAQGIGICTATYAPIITIRRVL
ncbi:MAG: C40 family peptidase [Schaedlerella sp.]|uniref:C40 family peptidase n=1 Tax=Schaedlerella sp. TaxID=2676057 RepID=UPI0027296C21|nr:C40 family peptidase [uncultured Schaedlerella sp.]